VEQIQVESIYKSPQNVNLGEDHRVQPGANMFKRIEKGFRSIARIFQRDAADPGPPNFFNSPSLMRSRPPSQESQEEEKSKPVALSNLKEHCRERSESSNLGFDEEFDELSQVGRKQDTTAGYLTLNRGKNRYNNIIPYDHSRVKLAAADDPGETEEDYINANFIPGFHSKREFIATQGPLFSTQDDFWRMIWETNAKGIVMVTNLVERGQDKCSHYWPAESTPVVYGDVKVHVLEETEHVNWTFRQLAVEKVGENEEEGERRQLPHLHFTTWPDKGVPESPDTLNGFVRFVREHLKPREEPIVVHCSAGVGRTGTFIAVDRLRQEVHHDHHHDVDVKMSIVFNDFLTTIIILGLDL